MQDNNLDSNSECVLEGLYNVALQTLPIQNQAINSFLTQMLHNTVSGAKIAAQIVNRKIEARDDDGYDAMRAFEFVETILKYTGSGQTEFCEGLCNQGFFAIVERTALNLNGNARNLPVVRERVIRFIQTPPVTTAPQLFKQKLKLVLTKLFQKRCIHQQPSSPTTPTPMPAATNKRKHSETEADELGSNSEQIRNTIHPNTSPVKKFEIKRLTAMREDMRELWKVKKFTDMTFLCSNGKIKAHKAIVAGRSSVFQTMIVSAMNESAPFVPTIVDVGAIKVDTMNLLLEFIYTGCVNPPNRTAMISLIRAADQYEMDSLKQACFRLLFEDSLSVSEEFGELLILSHNCNAWDGIKHDIQEYLMRNKTELMQLEGFQKLVTEFPTEFATISLGTFYKK